ncbi:hypothetical protein VTK73DRAFT_3593 [Phialemonium thermophilum]|uniref:Uncharacterized protein n=1 Tax=Phialemonium thermophilum TaxID=223376 RepID=A0ABR3WYD1_9PEZI
MMAAPKSVDVRRPHVMVQAGNAGDVGEVERSELLFIVRGATAEAMLVEWDVASSAQNGAANFYSWFSDCEETYIRLWLSRAASSDRPPPQSSEITDAPCVVFVSSHSLQWD